MREFLKKFLNSNNHIFSLHFSANSRKHPCACEALRTMPDTQAASTSSLLPGVGCQHDCCHYNTAASLLPVELSSSFTVAHKAVHDQHLRRPPLICCQEHPSDPPSTLTISMCLTTCSAQDIRLHLLFLSSALSLLPHSALPPACYGKCCVSQNPLSPAAAPGFTPSLPQSGWRNRPVCLFWLYLNFRFLVVCGQRGSHLWKMSC